MLRSSSFNYFLAPEQHGTEACPTRVFSAVSRRAFRFATPWEDVLSAARGDAELTERLMAVGLVTLAEDYLGEVDELLERKAEMQRHSVQVCFTVTTECQQGCDYCFQTLAPRQPTTPATVDRVVSLIDRHLERSGSVERVEMILFGGDALIRPDLCCRVLSRLGEVCASRGVELASLLTTNGTLADETNLAEMQRLGLGRMQVSFDGPRAEHERVRPGTFDTICGNLRGLAERFSLAVKYNITPANASTYQFANFLASIQHALGHLPFTVILEAIHATTTSEISRTRYYAMDSVELAERFVALSQASTRLGVRHHIGAAFHPPCFMTAENAVMVQPNGVLSVCDTAYDLPDFVLGNVFTLDALPLGRGWVREHVRNTAARTCARHDCCFLPLCEGGCLYEKRRRGLAFDHALCRRQYFERLLPYLYEREMSPVRNPPRGSA